MKKKELIRDCRYLLLFTILILAMLKLLFYKEPIINIFYLVLACSFIVILPGYLFANLVLKELHTGDKILFGSVFMIGLAGVLSYYSGLIFGNLFYSLFLIILIIAVLVYLNYFTKEKPIIPASNP